ncbi:hypothetical protein G9A89_006770 [Geosiphon pyriformis]|nr:hypothetical protein G9A89_006770 [Geosiphon pyriformis]
MNFLGGLLKIFPLSSDQKSSKLGKTHQNGINNPDYNVKYQISPNKKTFKGKKPLIEGTKQYQLQQYAKATLGSGNLRLAVVLPDGEDLNEWLAVNTYDFFNQINMLYSTITEFCTPQQCPIMSAGSSHEYHWSDGAHKKPVKLSAPAYVDRLMQWIQNQLDDESIFPIKIGDPFPRNFREIVRTIFKRLFRVYAHIYLSHMSAVVALEETPHLNTSLKHFILFVQEFALIDQQEMQPLSTVIEALMKPDS